MGQTHPAGRFSAALAQRQLNQPRPCQTSLSVSAGCCNPHSACYCFVHRQERPRIAMLKTSALTFSCGASKTIRYFAKIACSYPCIFSVRGPDDTRTERLTLQQIRERRMQIIVDEKVAAELHNTEGRLCESKAVVRHNRATFTQYSCETDVYGNRFHFVFLRGCWWLQRVDYSGG
jgi:hypothetical protein